MFTIGIIGCGSIAHTHVSAIQQIPSLKIGMVCDIEEQKAADFSRRLDCPYVTDYHGLIAAEGIDAVHICTPHYLHHSMAIDALNAGKHVFCEKPMAIHPSDAENMIAAARRNKRTLGICFQNRYNRTSQEAKRLIDSGRIGKVLGGKGLVTWNRGKAYYASGDWRGKWATEGGGVLINQSIHTLDLLNWLCGGTRAIKGHTDRFLLADTIEVEDAAMANLMLKNGGNAVFFATNDYAADSAVEVEIVCEKAVLHLDDKLTVRYADHTDVIENDTLIVDGKPCWGNGHKIAIEDFYRCIEEGRPFPICGEEGIQAIRLIRGLYDSEKSGTYQNT